MAYGRIYLIQNTLNGKAYIGKTTQSMARRKGEHVYRAKRSSRDHSLYLAMRKHGVDKFKFTLLRESDSQVELDALEKIFINLFDSYHRGYNMNEGGTSVGDETRKKLSSIFKGREIPWHHKAVESRKRSFAAGLFTMNTPSGDKNARSKSYVITDPDGIEHHIKGLNKWCSNWERDKLHTSNLVCCAKGLYKQYKGYKCRYADFEPSTTIPKGSTSKRMEMGDIL